MSVTVTRWPYDLNLLIAHSVSGLNKISWLTVYQIWTCCFIWLGYYEKATHLFYLVEWSWSSIFPLQNRLTTLVNGRLASLFQLSTTFSALFLTYERGNKDGQTNSSLTEIKPRTAWQSDWHTDGPSRTAMHKWPPVCILLIIIFDY